MNATRLDQFLIMNRKVITMQTLGVIKRLYSRGKLSLHEMEEIDKGDHHDRIK